MKTNKYINSLKSLENKTVVITGANSGIGLACTIECAKKGARVIMAARNKERLNNAKETVLKTVPNANIEIFIYDQSSFESIVKFVSFITSKEIDFDILFLNAGILNTKENYLTSDGFPIVVGTNFLGLLKLTNLIWPFLESSNKERKIVFEGSIASRVSKYLGKDADLINSKSTSIHSYNISKLGVENLFLDCLKKNKNENIKFYLAEPGAAKSKIYYGLPNWIHKPADIFVSLIFNDTLKGSLTALTLICNDEQNGTMLVPKHLFTLRGYPKQYRVKKKTYKYSQIIDDAKSLLN